MKENKDKEVMGELNISLETFPYQKKYYSFVLTKMLYTGGANPRFQQKHSSSIMKLVN